MIKARISGCVFEDMFQEGSYHGPKVITQGVPHHAKLIRIEPADYFPVTGKPINWHLCFDDGFEEVREMSIQALSITAEEAANRECEFGTMGIW